MEDRTTTPAEYVAPSVAIVGTVADLTAGKSGDTQDIMNGQGVISGDF